MTTPRYLVGCWTFTDPDHAQATPAYVLQADAAAAEPLAGPATAVYYGAADPNGRGLMLLHNDLHRSAMSRQQFNAEGDLVELGRWSSGGDGGSYIAFDRTGAYFAVANARTGWAVFRDGDTPELIALLENDGSGPHPRQAGSHPHCVTFSPDNQWIYAADMGTDEVLVFAFDAASGTVGPRRRAYGAKPGSGPRHLLFHGGLAYLLNELGNTLIVLRDRPDGTLEELQVVATLPDGFTDFSHTAHLAAGPGGRLVLASNRGHDSIVAFTLDGDGLVAARTWSPSGGKWPWFFLVLTDGQLLVANTLSDRITNLAAVGRGVYREIGHASVVRPVCVLAA